MTPIVTFFESLDPERTIEEYHRRADEALVRFRMPCARITDWHQFYEFIVFFCLGMETALWRLRELMATGDACRDYGRFAPLVDREFGEDGIRVAYRLADSGLGGGLRQVLRRIADRMVMEYVDQHIRYTVHDFWTWLNPHQRQQVVIEYMRLFGYLVPPEIRAKGLGEVECFFPDVLLKHPYQLHRVRQANAR